jgi:2',3'-cyclic-nucleotide 2'-phosphodiesterase (5'-nucleotidase family)
LGRFAGWVDASQKAEPSPSLLVHAGYFFADAIDYMGQPRPDAMEMNGWMARGLDLVGFDAINVSAHDVLGLADVGEIGSLPLVSANVSGPGIKRWVVVERGGIRIGVTGVTAAAPSMAPENGYLVRPLSAALPLLAELADQVQVVVLLSWGSPEELDTLLRAAPGIDVVVEANLYPEGPPASLKRGAVRTYSTFQGVQAGELRVDFHEGEVVGALDRRVNLDDVVPARETVSALMSKAKPAIDAVQRSIYGE